VGSGAHLALGAVVMDLFAGAGFLAQGRSQSALVAMLWSGSAVFVPLAILIALYYRIAGFDRSVPFASFALLLAAAAAYATHALDRRAPRPGSAASGAIFATGAVAALSLALTMALEKGWLTVALALTVAGIAWIQDQRPLPALRQLAALMTAVVLARVGYEPRIMGPDVGTTPIFNWILYGYGIPAAAFWLGSHLLRRRGDDEPARVVESGALLFTVLLAFLEIRHFMTGGNIYAPMAGLTETALQASTGLALLIGLERSRARRDTIVRELGGMILAAGVLLLIVEGLGIRDNPIVSGEDVGGVFFNLLLLGYFLPALLAGALAVASRGVRPPSYQDAATITAVALGLLYVGLEVRRLYHGPVLTIGPTDEAEQYTYVVIWLLLVIALERVRARTPGRQLYDAGATAASALGLAWIALGLGIIGNPMITGRAVGGPFVNLILFGYGVPALLVTVLGLWSRSARPPLYRALAAITAVALALCYLSLEVRRLYHGPVLTEGPLSDAEQYTYSAVWLAFGVALLAVGIRLRSRPVRFASAAVVTITVLKVFLVDMSNLTGIYQALSFIGLGLVLIGIGWFYQRLLFPRQPVPGAATESSP
jgi:uncharacterized membrane protein